MFLKRCLAHTAFYSRNQQDLWLTRPHESFQMAPVKPRTTGIYVLIQTVQKFRYKICFWCDCSFYEWCQICKLWDWNNFTEWHLKSHLLSIPWELLKTSLINKTSLRSKWQLMKRTHGLSGALMDVKIILFRSLNIYQLVQVRNWTGGDSATIRWSMAFWYITKW